MSRAHGFLGRIIGALVVLASGAAASARAATIVVDSTADSEADDGVCTLREAAGAANDDAASGVTPGECAAGSGGDDVIFALEAGSVIALLTGAVTFTESVSLWGPGAEALEITQLALDRVLTLDGNADPTSTFAVVGMTLSGGRSYTSNPGLDPGKGGALLAYHVKTQLTIAGVTFRSNYAQASGGALSADAVDGNTTDVLVEDSEFELNSVNSGLAGGGGAIALDVQGSAVIRRCLFHGNDASNSGITADDDGQGGALWVPPGADGTLEISESTFSDNRAAGNGGAVAFGSISAVGFNPTVATTIVDSTFTSNSADSDGDSASAQSGGALSARWTSALVTLKNSIFAGNLDLHATDPAPDLYGSVGALATGGHNFVGIRYGAGAVFPPGQPNANDDWVGTVNFPIDAELGPLADNGGPTESHLPTPAPASPVTDQGSCTGAPSVSDQRDWNDGAAARIHDEPAIVDFDDGCDIGALETHLGPPATIFVDGFDPFGDWRFWSGIVGWEP
jgi:CSLREA domain-containing protein